jgi:multiple sugar transport system permease protein
MQPIGRFLKRNWAGYFFIAPWFIGIVLLTMIPIVASLVLSFTNYNLFQPPTFVGLRNYAAMLKDSIYLASVSVTLRYVFIGVPLQLIMALGIALLLNRGLGGLEFYRAVYYIPSLLGGSVAIAVLWRQLFGGDGLVNGLLHSVGIQGMNWISDPRTALSTLIILSVWQFGASMVIFLAGLRQIPIEYYESARMDGAGSVRQFISITFPILTPVLFFNLVMQIINSFQAFTSAFVISDGTGGPLNSTNFYTLNLYQQGFNYFHMGYASAMAWVLLVAISFVTALLFVSSNRWVFYLE